MVLSLSSVHSNNNLLENELENHTNHSIVINVFARGLSFLPLTARCLGRAQVCVALPLLCRIRARPHVEGRLVRRRREPHRHTRRRRTPRQTGRNRRCATGSIATTNTKTHTRTHTCARSLFTHIIVSTRQENTSDFVSCQVSSNLPSARCLTRSVCGPPTRRASKTKD